MKILSALLFMLGAVFVEIAGMIVVGRHIGVLPTLLLLALAMAVGFILLRYLGKDYVSRAKEELERGVIPERAIVDGSIHFIACLLLITPGFISDIVALLLFVPIIRTQLWRILSRRMVIRAYPPYQQNKRNKKEAANQPMTIDLDAQNYQAQNPENSPWRRVEDEKNDK